MLTDTNDVVNPQIVNIYEPYKLQTPSKLTGSFAYVFGKSGLISVDYAIKDYSNTKFKPENDPYFNDLNSDMNSILDTTGELRIGAEYKIEALSLRAGYRYEQSPYKNSSNNRRFNWIFSRFRIQFWFYQSRFSVFLCQKKFSTRIFQPRIY